MSAPEYHIACLADFLTVPAEKQAECLRDFEVWLDMARQQDTLSQGLTGLLGGEVKFHTGSFTWIDDGTAGLSSVDIRDKDGDVVRLMVGRGAA